MFFSSKKKISVDTNKSGSLGASSSNISSPSPVTFDLSQPFKSSKSNSNLLDFSLNSKSSTNEDKEKDESDSFRRKSFFGKRFTSGGSDGQKKALSSSRLAPSSSEHVPVFFETLFSSGGAHSNGSLPRSKTIEGALANMSLGSLDNIEQATILHHNQSLRKKKDSRSKSTIPPGRMSLRVKDVQVLEQFVASPAVSDSPVLEPLSSHSSELESVKSEDESVDVDDDSSFGISAQLRQLHVYVRDSKEFTAYRVLPKASVSDIINDMINDIIANENVLDPDEMLLVDNWKMCKIERNLLATRLWLQNDQSLEVYKINDGDELRLKYLVDGDSLRVLIPNEQTPFEESFDFDETVLKFKERLIKTHNVKAPPDQRLGLYYKKIGIWLDDKRHINSYEIEPDSIIELRTVIQEFLLRVTVTDVETKFTIKVLPTLTVADALGMIIYTLSIKRIALDGYRRGGEDVYTPPSTRTKPRISEVQMPSGRKLTKFGLYLPSKDIWLAEGKMLSEYNLINYPDEIQYRAQYHPVTISLASHMAARRIDLVKNYLPDGRQTYHASSLIQVFVDSETKVKDLIELLNMDNPDFKEHVLGNELNSYGLFTRGYDALKPEDSMWNILKDLSPLEILDYRMVRHKLTFASTADIAVKIDVEVDFSKPLRNSIPLFCRKFGVKQDKEFKCIHLLGTVKELDISKTLVQLRVPPESTLVFTVEYLTGSSTDPENIWHEPEDSNSNLQFEAENDKIVTLASLNKLIEQLTSGEEIVESSYYLDFMKTFLLTYQSFTTPILFLKKLIERYHVPRRIDKFASFSEFEKIRTKVQLRCCNVLQQWTKKHFYDFVDFTGILSSELTTNMSAVDNTKRMDQALAKHFLLIQVLDFAEQVLVDDHPVLAKQIRKNVLRLRDGSYLNQAQTIRQGPMVVTSPKGTIKNNMPGGDLNLFTMDSEELARQFTLMEFDVFARIMPYEFLNQGWTKSNAEIKCPNVIGVTKRFNEVAMWVAKSILEVKSIKNRIRRMSKLIEVAAYLYNQNNFSTLMAFIAGFNKAAVNRLKHTFKEVPPKYQKKFLDLERLMSAESSYKMYRSKLHQVNPPCIPYIGVYLLDLTYMEDGNPNNIDGLINFSKRRLINNLIREVQQYQDQPYTSFKVIESAIQSIQKSLTLPIASEHSEDSKPNEILFESLKAYEDHLFNLSLVREPRNVDRSQIQ